jgi:hypothetical protein
MAYGKESLMRTPRRELSSTLLAIVITAVSIYPAAGQTPPPVQTCELGNLKLNLARSYPTSG